MRGRPHCLSQWLIGAAERQEWVCREKESSAAKLVVARRTKEEQGGKERQKARREKELNRRMMTMKGKTKSKKQEEQITQENHRREASGNVEKQRSVRHREWKKKVNDHASSKWLHCGVRVKFNFEVFWFRFLDSSLFRCCWFMCGSSFPCLSRLTSLLLLISENGCKETSSAKTNNSSFSSRYFSWLCQVIWLFGIDSSCLFHLFVLSWFQTKWCCSCDWKTEIE